jgi:putative DNA primase/helicase
LIPPLTSAKDGAPKEPIKMQTAPRTFARQGPPPASTPEALAELQARLTGESAQDNNPCLSAALAALQAGLSPVPARPGEKRPIGTWKEYQSAAASEAEVHQWYANGNTSLGLVTGAISGNLEALDFDSKQAWADYKAAAHATGLGELLARVAKGYAEESPHGFHLLYRCAEIEGNTKLSQVEGKTLIETRGEGGFIVIAPSNIGGNSYTLKAGGFDSIVTISPQERDLLHRLARSFDQSRKASPARTYQGQQQADGGKVGDQFNASTTWAEILEPCGWQAVYEVAGTTHWRRPNKSEGTSATTGHAGSDLLWVFTSNASPLEPERSYDRFGAWAALEHNGDFKQATKAAAQKLGIEHKPGPATPGQQQQQHPPKPGEWPAPQALTDTTESLPYPADALPDPIRAAVAEVLDFTQAPAPMAAASALSALSLAAQGLADVERAKGLAGPCSLFQLILADSGERKTSLDNLFIQPIRQWEQQQAEAAAPELRDYQAAVAAWEASRAGLKERIKANSRAGKSIFDASQELRHLEDTKPAPPMIPRLLYLDSTSEALAANLARGWPSAGLISSEAGSVLGGHSMGKDQLTKTLSLLNQLWDGASLTIDRKTSESFTLKGARLSVSLQLQEPILRAFLEQSGQIARGSGFLARFLLTWPESTQGTRFFKEAPDSWPALSGYHRRLFQLLDLSLPLDQASRLDPPKLALSHDARQSWVEFHDAIESELADGGELRLIRDTAAKAADNAARLACLFHLFEHGPQGEIGPDSFSQAARIVAWHLNESRRFFGELAQPQDQADAIRLDGWLLAHCHSEGLACVSTREALRAGPIRDSARLLAALQVLDELDRAKLVQQGKRRLIYPNPQLLEV